MGEHALIIMGADAAARTGFAVWDTSKPPASIKAWSVRLGDGNKTPPEEMAWWAGKYMVGYIQTFRPDFFVVEQPFRHAKQFDQKPGQDLAGEFQKKDVVMKAPAIANQVVGALIGVCGGFDIPGERIASSTWRKAFLGFGTKRGLARKDWKKLARKQCDILHITTGNDDEAEAVGIAWAGTGLQRFKALQQGGLL